MKISTKGRYGTRIMLELARCYGEAPVYLKNIAKSENISEKYLSSIVQNLKTAGLVISFRGANGGYILGAKPEEITLLSILEALEGHISLVDCTIDSNFCNRSEICIVKDIWTELGMTIKNFLVRITLADMLKRLSEKNNCVFDDYVI